MEYTQGDFEERLARADAGTDTDEDRRLIKQYRREGFTADAAVPVRNPFEQDDDTDVAADYSKMTKKQLTAELDKRKNEDGAPLHYPPNAPNATYVELLERNDRMAAERSEN